MDEIIQHTDTAFKIIFESVPDLYLLLSPQLTIINASNAYLNATLTQREIITGRGIFEVFPDNPHDPAANGVFNLHASLNMVLQHKVPNAMPVQKYDILTPDGVFEERFWKPVNSPVLNKQNEVIYIIHRVEDITEQELLKKESAEQLKEKQEDIIQLNKEMEAFSYSVSHDLRAPLRAVTGYAQILKEDHAAALDHEGKRYLHVISDNAEKMGHLIDDLLRFARLGKAELHKKETSLYKLVDTVISERTDTHRAEIAIDVPHNINSDGNLMKQVITNLIDNAIKYSSKKEKPQINIRSELSGNEIVFSVRDNGAGFDMRYIDKLFGVFQRLHTAEEFEGTGVGLAIVQRIVNKHGGRVWAESAVNEGATLYFSIPQNQNS